MATERAGRFETASLTGLHWLAIVLAFLTGVIHVFVGVVGGRLPLTLAGLGFFGAIVLFLADVRRQLLYVVGIVYTGIQVVLWLVVQAGEYTTIGYVDKAIQVVLIAILAYLYWHER